MKYKQFVLHIFEMLDDHNDCSTVVPFGECIV